MSEVQVVKCKIQKPSFHLSMLVPGIIVQHQMLRENKVLINFTECNIRT